MDAVLAVRFRPFLGGKRGQDVGGIHGCGDQDGMCQPLPRSWGTNNSGLLARSLRTGDLPSIGKSCAYNPCSGNGKNRNEVLKGLTGKKFVTREVFV